MINPPFLSASDCDDLFPPLGLAYLASVLRDDGHDVSLYDAAISRKPRKTGKLFWYGQTMLQIEKRLQQEKYDIVGIGCFFSMRFKYALQIAKLVKKINPNTPVVTGGIHATTLSEEVMKNPEIDYIVIGEGEETIIELVNAIKADSLENISRIDGLAYRKDNRTHINPKTKFIQDLDSLPLPARDLLDMEYYITSKAFRWDLGDERQASIITSRGCPNHCTFCNMYEINGRGYRARSAKKVVDEIEQLIKDYKIKDFSFEDDNLTFDRQRIIDICKEIIVRGIKIRWNTPNGVSVKALDKEVLESMKKSGCVSINLAIESGDPYILNKVIKKGLSLEKVSEIANACKKIGLIVNAYFVLGMPGETKKSVKKSIKFANSIPLDKMAIFFATPFPGTKLYDECIENKYISQNYHKSMVKSGFVLYDKPIIITPLMSKKDLIHARRMFFISFLINKLIKNRKEMMEMLVDFFRDENFRKKVFVSLKRYVMGK